VSAWASTSRRRRQRSLNNMYVKDVRVSDLMADGIVAQTWDRVDLSKPDNQSVREARWSGRSPRRRRCTASRCGGFARSRRASSCRRARSAGHPLKQIYLPVEDPLTIEAGEQLHVGITSDTRPRVKINVAWEVSRINTKARWSRPQRLDMRKGY